MSGSGCMAPKTSCESERTVRGLEMTCLHTDISPFLPHSAPTLGISTDDVIEHLLLTLGWHFKFTDQSYPWNSSMRASHWRPTHWVHGLTRQVLSRKLIPKHWKRSLFILLSMRRSSWLWDCGPRWIFRVKSQAWCGSCPHCLERAATKTAYTNHIYQSFPFSSWSRTRGQRLLNWVISKERQVKVDDDNKCLREHGSKTLKSLVV